MAEKRYYYLKLKENFFETDELKILESLENGYLYSNILLKLYLRALKNEGKLTFNDYIPYDIKMLATLTGHNIDIVDKAIKIFQSMHLIEILDNGTIYMADMQKMIGSISDEGLRKAEYREKINKEKENGTKLGHCPTIISLSNSNLNLNNNNLNNNNKNNINNNIYKEIIEYLNKVTGKNYKPSSTETRKHINARLREGYTLEDFKKVIDIKYSKWRGTDMETYLRPTTLFGNKFESYINETPKVSDKGFNGRNYTNTEYNQMYDNLDEIEI